MCENLLNDRGLVVPQDSLLQAAYPPIVQAYESGWAGAVGKSTKTAPGDEQLSKVLGSNLFRNANTSFHHSQEKSFL